MAWKEQLQHKPLYIRRSEEEQEVQDKHVQTTDSDEEPEEEDEEWTKERKQHIDESISFLKQQLVGLHPNIHCIDLQSHTNCSGPTWSVDEFPEV